MVNKKTLGKGIIVLALILILSQTILGFGIAPSSKEIIFEPGKTQTVKMKIINNEKAAYDALVYAEGPLSEYITINDELISFSEGEKERIISYTINLPDSMDKQGLIESEVIIRQIPKSASGSGSQVTASIAVGHRVKLKVPFSGKYAEARLFVGNFKQGQASNFAVEVKNLGEQDLISVKVLVDIIGPLNNKLASLRSEEISMASKETMMISVPWTPALGAGVYKAVATVIFDEQNLVDEKTFTLGEPTVSVDSISVGSFKLGGIAKFAMAISSNWNLPIDEVFAQATFMDKADKVYTQYKTATTYLDPFGKQVLDAFWDTSKVLAGPYILKIDLGYLDKTTQETFEIFVEQDDITTTPTGKAISKEEEENSTIIRVLYILMFLIIGLIIFNVMMFIRRRKKADNYQQ